MFEGEDHSRYGGGFPGQSEQADSKQRAIAPSVQQNDRPRAEEIIEVGDNFDLNQFQVVRREFFAHTREPAVSFANYKMQVNNACLTRFPNVDYVQVLVNQQAQVMALMPCHEGDRDSFAWCSTVKGKRKAKQITCRLFFAKIFSMMNWNLGYRYKLLGKVIHSKGDYLIAFDLKSTEVYQRRKTAENKMRTSRQPVFPEEWKNQFGLTYDEHQKSLQVNIFEGYAVYAIKENSEAVTKEAAETTGNEGNEQSDSKGAMMSYVR